MADAACIWMNSYIFALIVHAIQKNLIWIMTETATGITCIYLYQHGKKVQLCDYKQCILMSQLQESESYQVQPKIFHLIVVHPNVAWQTPICADYLSSILAPHVITCMYTAWPHHAAQADGMYESSGSPVS